MSAIKSYSSTKERQSSGSFILYARITSAALYYIIIFLKRNHWIERDFQRSNNGIFNHFMLKRIVSVSEFRLLLSIHYLPRIILQYVHQSFNFTTRSFTADLLFERNSIYITIFFLCSSACLSKKMTRWQWLSMTVMTRGQITTQKLNLIQKELKKLEFYRLIQSFWIGANYFQSNSIWKWLKKNSVLIHTPRW